MMPTGCVGRLRDWFAVEDDRQYPR
jgi:hypothetical protein